MEWSPGLAAGPAAMLQQHPSHAKRLRLGEQHYGGAELQQRYHGAISADGAGGAASTQQESLKAAVHRVMPSYARGAHAHHHQHAEPPTASVVGEPGRVRKRLWGAFDDDAPASASAISHHAAAGRPSGRLHSNPFSTGGSSWGAMLPSRVIMFPPPPARLEEAWPSPQPQGRGQASTATTTVIDLTEEDDDDHGGLPPTAAPAMNHDALHSSSPLRPPRSPAGDHSPGHGQHGRRRRRRLSPQQQEARREEPEVIVLDVPPSPPEAARVQGPGEQMGAEAQGPAAAGADREQQQRSCGTPGAMAALHTWAHAAPRRRGLEPPPSGAAGERQQQRQQRQQQQWGEQGRGGDVEQEGVAAFEPLEWGVVLLPQPEQEQEHPPWRAHAPSPPARAMSPDQGLPPGPVPAAFETAAAPAAPAGANLEARTARRALVSQRLQALIAARDGGATGGAGGVRGHQREERRQHTLSALTAALAAPRSAAAAPAPAPLPPQPPRPASPHPLLLHDEDEDVMMMMGPDWEADRAPAPEPTAFAPPRSPPPLLPPPAVFAPPVPPPARPEAVLAGEGRGARARWGPPAWPEAGLDLAPPQPPARASSSAAAAAHESPRAAPSSTAGGRAGDALAPWRRARLLFHTNPTHNPITTTTTSAASGPGADAARAAQHQREREQAPSFTRVAPARHHRDAGPPFHRGARPAFAAASGSSARAAWLEDAAAPRPMHASPYEGVHAMPWAPAALDLDDLFAWGPSSPRAPSPPLPPQPPQPPHSQEHQDRAEEAVAVAERVALEALRSDSGSPRPLWHGRAPLARLEDAPAAAEGSPSSSSPSWGWLRPPAPPAAGAGAAPEWAAVGAGRVGRASPGRRPAPAPATVSGGGGMFQQHQHQHQPRRWVFRDFPVGGGAAEASVGQAPEPHAAQAEAGADAGGRGVGGVLSRMEALRRALRHSRAGPAAAQPPPAGAESGEGGASALLQHGSGRRQQERAARLQQRLALLHPLTAGDAAGAAPGDVLAPPQPFSALRLPSSIPRAGSPGRGDGGDRNGGAAGDGARERPGSAGMGVGMGGRGGGGGAGSSSSSFRSAVRAAIRHELWASERREGGGADRDRDRQRERERGRDASESMASLLAMEFGVGLPRGGEGLPGGGGGGGGRSGPMGGAYGRRYMGFGGAFMGPGLGALMGGGGGGSGMYQDLLMGALRSGLPPSLLLSDRDFTADDYEALCRLDDTVENRKGASQAEIDALPTQVVPATAATAGNAPPAEGDGGALAVPATEQGAASAAAAAAPAPAVAALPQPGTAAQGDHHDAGATQGLPSTAGDVSGGAPTQQQWSAQQHAACLPGSGRCTVCLDEWAEGDVLRRLPCAHCFHKDCVDVWLRARATCPICQRDIRQAAS